MNICFVISSWHYFADPFKLQPMAELYLATVLRDSLNSETYNVSVFDMRESRKGYGFPIINYDFFENIPESNIYIFWINKTADSVETYETSGFLRKKFRKSVTFAGGVHVESLPDECAKIFDAVIIGPGEETLKSAVKDFEKGALEKKYISGWNRVEYEEYPFMDRSFLPYKAVVNRELFKTYGGKLATSFLFSRGCNFKCSYCVYNVPHCIQRRTNHQVAEEIEYMREGYGIEAMNLRDEIAIPLHERTALDFIETMGAFGMIWRGQTRFGATEKALKYAAESGCVELAVGLESVSQNALDIVNKGQKVGPVLSFVETCKKHGIKVKMCLILGLPGEERDIVEKTIEAIERVEPDFVNVSGFCPVPGSDIFINFRKYGIKYIDNDWQKHAHLMMRYSDDEEFGLPFEYEEMTEWGKAFSREELAGNIRYIQEYLRSRKKIN